MYVNGQYDGDDNVGRLMHDFQSTNPKQMYFDTFRKRAHFLKTDEEGVKEMSGVMEKFKKEAMAEGEAKGRAEGEAKGRAEGIEIGKFDGLKAVAKKMLSRKTYSNEEIAEVSGLPLAVIQKLAEQMA